MSPGTPMAHTAKVDFNISFSGPTGKRGGHITKPSDACYGGIHRVSRYGTALPPTYDTRTKIDVRDPPTEGQEETYSVRCGRVMHQSDSRAPVPAPPPARGEVSSVRWCQDTLDFGTDPKPPPPLPRCYTKKELKGSGWGYCPPCVDYRKLIRPLDPDTPSATRPTGQPYYNVGMRGCEPATAPLTCRKNRFTFCDWLSTVADREPPPHLAGVCVPSLCTTCQPHLVECCPFYDDPEYFTLTRAT